MAKPSFALSYGGRREVNIMLKKFATGLVTGSLILNAVIPALADTTVDVTGNGSGAVNTVTVREKCKQIVKQKNSTSAYITLNLVGNSGDNNANDNTNGNVTILTGDVKNTANVTVTGGDNTAEVPPCCCGEEANGTAVTVADNGTGTTNTVSVTKKKKTKVKQRTRTSATVNGTLNGKSGGNDSNDNTTGEVKVDSGKVENSATVEVSGGSNSL